MKEYGLGSDGAGCFSNSASSHVNKSEYENFSQVLRSRE